MSEDTTTTTELESAQAQEIEQPEELETQAVQAEGETEADTTNQTEESEDDILEWASKKGIKTDDTVSILKMVRESESKMHAATQEAKQAKELQNSVTNIGNEQGLDETSQLLDRLRVKEFYMDHPEAKILDEEMAKIVDAKPYLAEDLETVLELAQARTTTLQTVEARKLGQKEALAQVAKAEKAAPPQTSASTREQSHGTSQQDIVNMTPQEYVQYKKEHPEFNPFA